MKLDWYTKGFGKIHALGKSTYYLIAVDFADTHRVADSESEDNPEHVYVGIIMDKSQKRILERVSRKTLLGAKQYCQGYEDMK